MLYTCPGCGYRMFEDPPGSYDICLVCDWEDDEIQLRFPASDCGANHPGLAGHQAKVLPITSLPRKFDHLERDPAWRPLRPEDLDNQPDGPQSGLEYFETATALEEPTAYYWLRP